jgi:S-adenosylmethionine hydrolase
VSIITLTTDFGSGNPEAGLLRGVIWSITPYARIVDLSHDIPPFTVVEGALLLERCTPYFPDGTIHIAVVDPGVGCARRMLAARLGTQYFVGPDNGLLTLMLQKNPADADIVCLDRPEYWLKQVNPVFHGRDIFAPAAAHLAHGVPLSALGSPISDPMMLSLPRPQRTAQGWRGEIIQIDSFGNLAANVTHEQILELGLAEVFIAGQHIPNIVHTFGDRQPGDLTAMIDGSGHLSICVVNGSAQTRLNCRPGEPVEVKKI